MQAFIWPQTNPEFPKPIPDFQNQPQISKTNPKFPKPILNFQNQSQISNFQWECWILATVLDVFSHSDFSVTFKILWILSFTVVTQVFINNFAFTAPTHRSAIQYFFFYPIKFKLFFYFLEVSGWAHFLFFYWKMNFCSNPIKNNIFLLIYPHIMPRSLNPPPGGVCPSGGLKKVFWVPPFLHFLEFYFKNHIKEQPTTRSFWNQS